MRSKAKTKVRDDSRSSLTVVITGVTRGLGRAMLNEFVRRGHRVFGCGRTQTDIAELARLYPQHDFQALTVAADREVRAWSARILDLAGTPDLVLNNAAVLNMKAPLWEIRDADFGEEIDINVKGVVNVIRHFAPSMIRRRKGVLINFTSRWGVRTEKEMVPYCASKWAVVAITRAAAQELKPHGVALIGLNPGIVRTRLLRKYLGRDYTQAASAYITATRWAKLAVPFILRLRLKDSGKILSLSN